MTVLVEDPSLACRIKVHLISPYLLARPFCDPMNDLSQAQVTTGALVAETLGKVVDSDGLGAELRRQKE